MSAHNSLSAERRTVVVGRLDGLVARGLGALLVDTPGVHVLASGLGSAALAEAVVAYAPDVVIVDERIRHAQLCGLRSAGSVARIIVFVRAPSRLYAEMLTAMGAICVAPGVSEDKLRAAITSPRSETHASLHTGNGAHPNSLSAPVALTRREAKVFEYLRHGASYVEIGRALHISPETARSHGRSILKKLDLASKRDLIGHGLELGRTFADD